MNAKQLLPLISLGFLISLPLPAARAEEASLLTTLLRFTGISATPQTRAGLTAKRAGDIWIVQVGVAEAGTAQKITANGNYRSPLWIPGSSSLLAMKGAALVRLNAQGGAEKTIHTLSDDTLLLGFDKTDNNQLLLRQQNTLRLLSLANGKLTDLAYASNDPKNRESIDGLNDDFRDYGATQVYIDDQGTVDRQGRITASTTVIVERAGNTITINCLSVCSQAALADDGRQLLFIGR